MSKYGFDEKELRKTIVTMIDKDGFHKKVVTEGSSVPELENNELVADICMVPPNSTNFNIYAIANNIPDGTEVVAFVYFSNLDVYAFDIGDTYHAVSGSDFGNPYMPVEEIRPMVLFNDNKSAFFASLNKHTQDRMDRCYGQIYAIDSSSSVVVARAKI